MNKDPKILNPEDLKEAERHSLRRKAGRQVKLSASWPLKASFGPSQWTEEKLAHPDFDGMTQDDRLLRVVMMCYRKLHPKCELENVTEAEVSEACYNEICNTIGDAAFVEWNESFGGRDD